MKDLVDTAFPICAPTPAPAALTINIAARPATVTVVTPSTTLKTARPQGANNRPTLTTMAAPTAAKAVAQPKTVSDSCMPMFLGRVLELMAGTLCVYWELILM